MKGNVVGGIGYLVDGAKMLGHPALRLFVVVPLAINILIFGSLITLGLGYITDMMDRVLAVEIARPGAEFGVKRTESRSRAVFDDASDCGSSWIATACETKSRARSRAD